MLNNLKKLFYYRQHPETALRYLPVVDLLKKKGWEGKKILEVGSGSYGITPYLKRKVTGVDTNFSEPEYPLLEQINGSATKLPFKKNEFNIVILSDVLEHLPSKIRQECLNESVRVARLAVIISGPFGEEAAKQDKLLAQYSKRKLGIMHPYFKEHLELGLPNVEYIQRGLMKNPKVKRVKVVEENLNLNVREWIMKTYITKNPLKYYFYLKGLMPFVPLLRLFNRKPCYRKVLLVEVK